MDWKIYFIDQQIDSSQFGPFEIPTRVGIQVIIQEDPGRGWVTVAGYDYYIWDDRGGGPKWIGVDLFGLHHYLLEPGQKCVLFGVVIDKTRFYEIFEMAQADASFGKKTGFVVGEMRPNV